MNKSEQVVAGQVMVAGGCVLDAKTLVDDGKEAAGSQAQMVTVLVDVPLELKRQAHAEAKRREQSFSEFVCARCDFSETGLDI